MITEKEEGEEFLVVSCRDGGDSEAFDSEDSALGFIGEFLGNGTPLQDIDVYTVKVVEKRGISFSTDLSK